MCRVTTPLQGIASSLFSDPMVVPLFHNDGEIMPEYG